MKRETKLLLRKKTLMALRALLWHADEWLHRQEVGLREELSGTAPVRVVDSTPRQVGSTPAARSNFREQLALQAKQRVSERVSGAGCTIGSLELPLRACAGSTAPAPINRRRRGKTAAEFDLSLASRSMPLRFS
jgi:hypothetical protein